MVVPNILISKYDFFGRTIKNYKNCVVLRTKDFVGNPIEFILTKEPMEDYTYEYVCSKELLETNKLYGNNKEDLVYAIHLNLWFGA